MDFLTISELFLMLCLVIYMLASIKIAARKTTGSALAGVGGFTISLAVVLAMVSVLTDVSFCRDIAFALIVLSPVGTIAAATVLGGGEI
jgi:energy-converting hydrogenase B subunit B